MRTYLAYALAAITGVFSTVFVNYLYKWIKSDSAEAKKAEKELQKRVFESLDPNSKSSAFANINTCLNGIEKDQEALSTFLASPGERKKLAEIVAASVIEKLPTTSPDNFVKTLQSAISAEIDTVNRRLESVDTGLSRVQMILQGQSIVPADSQAPIRKPRIAGVHKTLPQQQAQPTS